MAVAVSPAQVDLLPAHPGLLIGDSIVTDSSGGRYAHRYAATGDVTREVALAGLAEIDQAVATARTAFPAWRGLAADKRRDILVAASVAIRAHADELVELNILDNGSPRSMVVRNPHVCADWFAYNAGWADKIGGECVTTWDGPALDYTIEEPYGVVGILLPWNGPIRAIGMSVATALATGNCVVLKPSELAPYSAVRIAEILLQVGLPAGVLNVVPSGPDAGAALCAHPGIDKLHFTGSAATARKVLQSAQINLTPATLELGGKSAIVVFADVDLETAARFAITGAIAMTGQGCMNATRVLVDDAIHEQFVKMCAAMLNAQPQGDPRDDKTVLGPVVSSTAVERILGFIERAQHDGARLVTGGVRLGGPLERGYFVAPTILDDVCQQSEIAQNEVFGPVLSFSRFGNESEAIDMANGTDYGLAAYIATNDLRRAHRVARELEAGTVMVNEMAPPSPAAPFGGIKASGYGRVGGRAGISEFTRPRNVRVAL